MTAAPLRWRPMGTADLPAVNAIAAAVHVDYPEDAAVFAERLALHPQGCYLLGEAAGDEGADREVSIAGYLISHPWRLGEPPALNALLGGIPVPASTYYIHDIALLPRARGSGAPSAILPVIIDHAGTLAENISLVAVGGTAPFWQRHGFAATEDGMLSQKLASYGDEACYMIRPLAKGER